MWVLLMFPRFGGAYHAAVTTIGLDIAKSVLQVHGVDAEGNVLIRRQLKRRYVLAFFQKRYWHLADISGRLGACPLSWVKRTSPTPGSNVCL
jgi:hypothetical protein